MRLWNGYAALPPSRAESLWLSVEPSPFFAAMPPEAKPLLILICERKARGLSAREGGKAAHENVLLTGFTEV